jgi:hypothetical protein
VCTYAAHDSTLTAVNAVLGRIGAWPPYAAHVEFELWRDDSDDAYYVQIVADGSVYRPWGATVDMLPLQWFQDQLRDVVISEQVRVCARVVWCGALIALNCQMWRRDCGSPFTSRAAVMGD